MITKVIKTRKSDSKIVQDVWIKIKKGVGLMKREYKVTRHFVETTEEEKEEIYKEIANIFIRMAQKDLERNKK